VDNFRPLPLSQPPVAWIESVCGPCFSAERPPLPMGCAVCGHPPYDHGCLHVETHDYRVPSTGQAAARWELIRAARLDELRMPARDWVRPAECLPAPAAQPNERGMRALRLSLAREPLTLRRARAAAARGRPPRSTAGIGHLVPGGPSPGEAARVRPGELAVHHTASRSPYSPGSTRWRPSTPVDTAA
jgi:hypothetical protein